MIFNMGLINLDLGPPIKMYQTRSIRIGYKSCEHIHYRTNNLSYFDGKLKKEKK